MIPHLSKLINISDLDNFDQLFSFEKKTEMFIIPKVYNDINPYINIYNNNYQILIYCESITSDNNYYNFLNNFLTDTAISNKNDFSLALFEVQDEKLNFIDIHSFKQNAINFFINLKSKQNLIFDGINITGIYYTQPNSYSVYEDFENLNYGNVFTVSLNNPSLDEQKNLYTSKYMFPDSWENTVTSNPINFIAPYSINETYYKFINYTKTTNYSEKLQLSYSNDNFQTKIRLKQYRGEYFDHIIPNVNDDNYVAIAYKTITIAPYMNIDIFFSGNLNTYKLNNVTSIQWIKDNTFQIVKDFILYECNLEQDTCTFYNFKELENLNTYLNGNIRLHENIIKYGSNIISEEWSFTSIYNTHAYCKMFINGVEFLQSTAPYGLSNVYLTQPENYKIGLEPIQNVAYEFKNFILFPRKRAILPIDIKNNLQKKTVYSDTKSVYVANREEDSIVKIENFNNVNILENDASLISESGNTAFYKMKSNIAFEETSNETSLLKIYNNIDDINGALKNIDYDSTNNILLKIDTYDYDLTNTHITFELNVKSSEINNLLYENKFLNLLNNNNSYYITQNGYSFNSISELKNDFINVLNNNYKFDEINLNELTTENVNYIEGVGCIQSTINSDLFAIANNFEQLKFGYNCLKENKIFNSLTNFSTHKSEFKIDKFITPDGTIYEENEINYKLYNLNEDIVYKIIFTVEKQYVDIENHIVNIEYIIDDISNCDNNYIINKDYLTLDNISHDTTNISFSSDNTTINISNIDTTSFNYEEIIEIGENIYLEQDESLTIDIELKSFNLDKNINNTDIFSSYKFNDFFDIHIEDDYFNHNIYHIDFIGKTFNTYKINLSNDYLFYTFGNLPKKCKTWLSTQYDYNENNTQNYFYGDYSTGILYNLMEQNSSKYFINRFISYEPYTEPTNSNDPCDAYFIKQNDQDVDTLPTSQSIDVWPSNKESHTLFLNTTLSDLVSAGNTMYSTYEQRYYLAKYGVNYCVLFNGINSTEQNLGQSIKPPTNYSNGNYLFNEDNCIGKNVYEFDSTNNNLCFTLNKFSNSNNQIEKLYIDNTSIDTVEFNNRINEFYTNGYDIYENFDYGSPLLNDYKYKTGVTYFSDLSSNTANQIYGGPLQNHIIDFDYELSNTEINYLTNNLTDILTKLFTEKRKMGSGVLDNDFIYKFIECGSYVYNIPRSYISIKFERKYSVIEVSVNGILVDEILTNDSKSVITKFNNYGNTQSGNKKITVYKQKNYVTKKSGLWC